MRKKGFTLIELLAVIVIISIIALIAVPIILNVIETAKKGSAKSSAINYMDSVEKKIIQDHLTSSNRMDGLYIITDDKIKSTHNEINVNMKGKLPSEGKMCIDKKGRIISYSLVVGEYTISKINGEEFLDKGADSLFITCEYNDEVMNLKISVTDQDNWTASKTVSIEGSTTYGKIQYQLGTTEGEWINYKKPFDIVENTTVYARLFNGKNSSLDDSEEVSKIDTTAPSLVMTTNSPNDSSIVVTCDSVDNESGIYGYQYSSDGGTTWTDILEENTYTFTSLTSDAEYSISARVINNIYLLNNEINEKNTTTSETKVTKVKKIAVVASGSGNGARINIPEGSLYVDSTVTGTQGYNNEWYNCDGLRYTDCFAYASAFIDFYNSSGTKISTITYNVYSTDFRASIPSGASYVILRTQTSNASATKPCYMGDVTCSTTSAISVLFYGYK